MTDNVLAQISQAGVSLWLDDLSRARLESGSLEELREKASVVGVTTNPTIFDNAISGGNTYTPAIAALGVDADPEAAAFEIMSEDVARACDVFADTYAATSGCDGRVSIEVSPLLAHDGPGTAAQAKALWEKVGRANAMIKIPATLEGLDAITEVIGSGISVNVTLIFSLERYRAVIDAYMAGLEKAKAAGIDLATIHSVASFFVSRVDTEIDARLEAAASEEARALKSKAGLANARLAYREFERSLASERWVNLANAGAHVQRPLWASTGVKDPSLPGYLYVTGLVAPNVVNTVPEKTLLVTGDEGVFEGDTISNSYTESEEVLAAVAQLGIDIDEVTAKLEAEGVEKFIASWDSLLGTVKAALATA